MWDIEVDDPPHKLALSLGTTTNPHTGAVELISGDADTRDGAEQNAVAVLLSKALNGKLSADVLRKAVGIASGGDADAAAKHKQLHDLIVAAYAAPSTAVTTLNSSMKGACCLLR